MTWFKGLTKVGLNYEGFVENLEEVLEGHRRCTMTSYGTRNSKKSNELQIEGNNKENDKDCILVQVEYCKRASYFLFLNNAPDIIHMRTHMKQYLIT